MNRIDFLREKLYTAIDEDDAGTVLTISQELDIEIVKYMASKAMLSNELQFINDTN